MELSLGAGVRTSAAKAGRFCGLIGTLRLRSGQALEGVPSTVLFAELLNGRGIPLLSLTLRLGMTRGRIV